MPRVNLHLLKDERISASVTINTTEVEHEKSCTYALIREAF
jgi:hypothetical protein